MSYREPTPRPLRLWYVTLAWKTAINPTSTNVEANSCWVWAKESSDAISVSRVLLKITNASDVFFANSVCGDKFGEVEARGPDAMRDAAGAETT